MHQIHYPKKEIQVCEKIMKDRGPTYLAATRLFGRDFRRATYAIYAFVRVADDFVDLLEPKTAQKKLNKYEQDWFATQKNEEVDTKHKAVLVSAAWVFMKYHINSLWASDFLQAMKTDLTKARYANYEELKNYMWGSAVVVGLMMTQIALFQASKTPKIPKSRFHNKDFEKLKPYATQLAEAMQLTNFLRDIDEDFVDRSRIYIPNDELLRFGIDEIYFLERKFDEKWQAMMAFQMARAENLYANSWKGIWGLPLGFRGAVGGGFVSAVFDQNKKTKRKYMAKKDRPEQTRKDYFFFVGICSRGVSVLSNTNTPQTILRLPVPRGTFVRRARPHNQPQPRLWPVDNDNRRNPQQ